MSIDKQERYGVYHATDLHAMIAPQPDHWYRDQSRHYTHVADVKAPLGQVLRLSNHIDHSWTDNPEVVWHIAAPVRSTSVGDVIVSRQNDRAWLVLPFGLQELLSEDAQEMGTSETSHTPRSPGDGKEGQV